MIKNFIILILALLLFGSCFLLYKEYKQKDLINESRECVQKLELLKESQREQMFISARDYIKRYSVEGMEVEFSVIKESGNWALLEARPLNIETDNVLVILEKIDGKWKTHTFGTILPDWEEKVPELFN